MTRYSEMASYGDMADALEKLPDLCLHTRRMFDLSQRQLAALAGVSNATVNRLEARTGLPRLDAAIRLLRAFDRLVYGLKENRS